MNIYKAWNFSDNPFKTTPLQPDQEGKQLLVGRKSEIKRILTRVFNPPSLVTVEGLNGVGKTSLVNVSMFDCYENFFNQKVDTLYIPCIRTFQLSSDKNPEDFMDEVLIEVSQTLIRRAEELQNLGLPIPDNSREINSWLNSPYKSTFQATLGPVGLGKNTETNTSLGFERSGFRNTVRNWLEEIFPNGYNGGVVCIIDNLEILETSDNARKALEQLRDTLFNFSGIRWVLCGALGIVKSIAASPRLEGLLHDPIEIFGINQEFAKEIFESRINYYKTNSDYYIPINADSFSFLFDVLSQNIRNTLSYANEYCMRIFDDSTTPKSDDEKENMFLEWVTRLSDDYYDAVISQLRPRAIKLFKEIFSKGSSFSPSDFEKFGFNSIPAMRPHVKDLETVGLVTTSKDDTDNRRKSIQLTAKGQFVGYAIRKKNNCET